MKLMNKDEFIAYELKFYFMKNKLKIRSCLVAMNGIWLNSLGYRELPSDLHINY